MDELKGHHDFHDSYFQAPWPVQRKEPEGELECPYCSGQNIVSSTFCDHCGRKINRHTGK